MNWRGRRGGFVAVALVAATTVAVAGGSVGAQDDGCEPPYLPMYGLRGIPSTDGETAQVYPDEPVERPDLDRGTYLHDDAVDLDSDGDGTTDEVESGDPLRITRGDGVVELGAVTGANFLGPASLELSDGDLDGDGRDELIVSSNPAGAGSRPRYFVVPGTTAVGSHDLADVAIELPSTALVVGDQGEGSGEDVLVQTSETGGSLVSGDDLMAVGPGGSVAAFEPFGEPIDLGFPMAVFRVGDGAPQIAFLTPGAPATISVWDEGEVTAYRTPDLTPAVEYSAVLRLIELDGEQYLWVGIDDRSGGRVWVWSIDDPCGTGDRSVPPVGTTPPPDASGADAIRGEATYTG